MRCQGQEDRCLAASVGRSPRPPGRPRLPPRLPRRHLPLRRRSPRFRLQRRRRHRRFRRASLASQTAWCVMATVCFAALQHSGSPRGTVMSPAPPTTTRSVALSGHTAVSVAPGCCRPWRPLHRRPRLQLRPRPPGRRSRPRQQPLIPRPRHHRRSGGPGLATSTGSTTSTGQSGPTCA